MLGLTYEEIRAIMISNVDQAIDHMKARLEASEHGEDSTDLASLTADIAGDGIPPRYLSHDHRLGTRPFGRNSSQQRRHREGFAGARPVVRTPCARPHRHHMSASSSVMGRSISFS